MTSAMTNELLDSLLHDAARHGRRAGTDGDPIAVKARSLTVRLIACAINGGRHPLVQSLAGNSGQGVSSLLTGSRTVGGPAAAAGINAAAITVAQCDDGLREASGHPGLHAFAAAWSIAEQQDAHLSDFLAAFATGWELGARLGVVLGRPRAGVHPHGGWGAAAAALATSTLVGSSSASSEVAIRTALSLAMTGPDSTTRDGGAAHFLLPARGTSNGVLAGLLQLRDRDAPINALEHFAELAHGRSELSPCPPRETPLLLSAYVKPLGLCAHTLTSWTLADQARATGSAEAIDGVEVTTYAAAAILAGTSGTTMLARQFSVPWAVAFGLTGRHPSPADADLATLAAAVTVHHDPSLDKHYPAGRPATAVFRRGSKVVFSGTASFHPGDRELPMEANREAAVVGELLADAGRPDVYQLIKRIATVAGDTPIREFTRMLTAAHSDTERKSGGIR